MGTMVPIKYTLPYEAIVSCRLSTCPIQAHKHKKLISLVK